MPRNFRTHTTRLALALLLSICGVAAASADTLTLAWDRNPESNVAGYIVYIGTASGAKSTAIDVGNNTTYSFTSAVPGVVYYMTVAAYTPGPVIGPAAQEIVTTTTNAAPLLSNPGNRSATVGVATSFGINTSDPNGDPVTLVAQGLPPGISLNATTKTISGTPTSAGSYSSSLTAYDPAGSLATVSFSWTIASNDTAAPTIAITGPTTAAAYATSSNFVTLTGTASDDIGVTNVTWASTSSSGTAAGTTSWSVVVPLSAGSNVITVKASDATGKTASASITVTYNVPAPATTTPPTTTTTSPASTTPPATTPTTSTPTTSTPTTTSKPSTSKPTTTKPATPAPLKLVSLTANRKAPESVGDKITFTAVASGGTAPYQYQWMLFDGLRWTVLQSWSTSASYTWKPSRANLFYRVQVWVRSKGNTKNAAENSDAMDTMIFPITFW